MRVMQLLAIAMVCPLAGMSWSCEPVEQSVGEYQAEGRPAEIAEPPRWPTAAPPATANDGGASNAQDPGKAEPPVMTPVGNTLPDPVVNGVDPAMPPHPTATIPSMPTPGATQDTCVASSSVTAKRKRVDMYILIDANITVTLPVTGLWDFITTGLRAFVRDAANEGVGVGLRFYGTQCDPDPYNTRPTVEVDVLPDNEDALVRALSATQTFGASPMLPAMQGGIYHQTARAMDYPDTKQVVVLATDGITQDFTCEYSVQDLQNVAADGFNANTSIETYIIGFGSPDTMSVIADDILARFSPLDSIAERGGTRKSIMLKTGDDPSLAQGAFESVRRAAQPCEYEMPEDMDPANLNLVFNPTGQVPRVDDAASCGTLPGYYYKTVVASATPMMIELCPASCKPLQSNDYTAVLLDGCPAMRR